MTRTWALAVCMAAGCASMAFGQPLGTEFVYQGQLRTGGAPATTPHDVRFTLYDAEVGGSPASGTLCVNDLTPTDGLFAVRLDFGAIFNGQRLFMQIDVRADTGDACGAGGGYTALSGRQELTIAPYAAYAMHAQTATTSLSLNGQPGAFYTDAANLSTGTLPDARLSGTVARTNVPQTFTAAMNFVNAGSTFAGSGALLTALNASSLNTGTVPDARLPGTIARTNQINLFMADQSITGNLRINSASSLAPLHVGGDGYFSGSVRIGSTNSPRSGTIRFNSSNRTFEGYNGAWWQSLTSNTTSVPATIINYSTPGSNTWIVPAGVLSIGIEAWGGGGGGGGSGSTISQDCVPNASGGGGGGAGGYGVHIVDVTPGDVIGFTVGTGGNGGGPGTSGVSGGSTSVTINGVPVIQANGGSGGGSGINEPLGSSGCATLSSFAVGGTGGTCTLANFSNQSGGSGTHGRRAYNLGGCGFPPPDIRPGCMGVFGGVITSITPSAASAGQGGNGGQHSGSSAAPGQNGSLGRVRIMY